MVCYAPLFLCLRKDPDESQDSEGVDRSSSQLDDSAVAGGADLSEAEGLLTAPHEEIEGSPRKGSSIYSKTGAV